MEMLPSLLKLWVISPVPRVCRKWHEMRGCHAKVCARHFLEKERLASTPFSKSCKRYA